MCGICGIYNPWGLDAEDGAALGRMTEVLAHRGPDDSGSRADSHAALGHTRLSIVDIDGGAQPMGNEDGSVWAVFNGEIYNFEALRADLVKKGHRFHSRSDTETLVHGYETYGEDLVMKLDGMFAFAVWDSRSRRLLLARDRVGKKPLYYARAGGRLLFASEIKSILMHPRVSRAADHDSLMHIMSFQHVPGEATAFQGKRIMPPANFMVVGGDGPVEETPRRYWFPLHIKAEKNSAGDGL
ncbi:MAG TPA: asparagine synthetase B, partial [bacterium]|nr:asparagine synthetase B [bacterium]